MKCLVAAALCLASVPALAAGDGPFCVYTNVGVNYCYYYSISTCQDAARSFQGVCGPNNAPRQQPAPMRPIAQQPQQQSVLGAMQYIQQQGEEGRRRGMEQQEFEARMAVLRAQQEAAQASQQAVETQQMTVAEGVAAWGAVADDAQAANTASGQAIYRCARSDGTAIYTSTPEPGCIYLGIGQ